SRVSQVLAAAHADRAVIAVARSATAEELGESPRCAIRALDTPTGSVLGERALPLEGTRCSLRDLVFPSAPDAPVVLTVVDLFDHSETTSEGTRTTTRSLHRVLVLDPSSLEVRGATTLPSRGDGEHDAELPLYDGRIPGPTE